MNGTNLVNTSHVSGATNATLVISNIGAADAGSYRVVVTNSHGSATSSNAILTVLLPPAIATPPVSQSTLLSSNASFTASASGTAPLFYKWYFNGTRLTDGGRVSGSSTTNLNISNDQMGDVGSYQLVVTNAYGAVTSAPASLLLVPLVGWGVNFFGELDFPLTLTNVMAVAAGDANLSYLNLMLKADSTVFGWGYTIDSQSNTPVTIPTGLSNAAAIAAGRRHGLVLGNDRAVTAFGDNSVGQATPPGGLSNVVAVYAGDDWSLALKNDGTVVAWGDNSYSQATPPAGLSNVVAVSAGGIHGLALRSDGTVVAWGDNTVGEASIPAGLSNVVAISAGYYHNLALKSDGTVVGWGDNLHGETNPPTGLSNVVAIAASYTLSLALRNDGTVVAWGDNFYGQSTPPQGLSNIVAVAAGGEYGLALLRNPATRVPPSIWWQGQTNQTVHSAQPYLFLPVVTGSLPMNYQWYFNGAPLPGETNQWLMLPAIQPGQAGSYQFTVSNNYGSVTSQVAMVFESPGFIGQPANQAVLVGGTASFSAVAVGIGTLGYQWYFNGAPLTDDGRVSGSTTTNLTISNVQSNNAGSYVLVATNNFGPVASQAAILTPLFPAVIVDQPASQAVLLSSNAVFSASASGTEPLAFQWYFNGAPLTNGGRISGAATNTLSITSIQTNDTGSYQLFVTNSYGSATSSMATLTVLVPASITSQPSNQAALLNTTASFTAAAAGTPALTYQWYFNGAPLTDTGRVTGSGTTNLSISNLQSNDFGPYQFVVTNDFGSATSPIVSLTLLIPAAIAAPPANLSVPLSSNATFTVSAIGTAPLGYQWYFNGTLLTNNSHIAGSTTTNLSISSVQTNDNGGYQVIVTNQFSAATSMMATLTVYVPVQITAHPASAAVPLGSNAAFSVAASGTALGYQWYFNGAPLSDNGRITGSATTLLSISSVQAGDAGSYTCLVTNLFSAASTRRATLTVLTNPGPSVRYVSLVNTNPSPPYLDWGTAATNIQDAIDAAVAGDAVVVSNGTYSAGGRAVYQTATNRVTIDKPVTVQSLNGPGQTIIQGFNTNAAVFRTGRCAYMTNGAVLSGFTLTSGYTPAGDVVRAQSGGGVWCESGSAVISNCVISGNTATLFGGGVFRGTLLNCVLSNNLAAFGGGACSNILVGCTLVKNVVGRGGNSGGGGGVSYSALTNCLLVANSCGSFGGGGAFSSTLSSCVLSNNSAGIGGGGVFGGLTVNSLISSNITFGSGGGAYSNTLINCVLTYNSANTGLAGGAYISVLTSCTVVSNRAGSTGGIWGGAASNSILAFNAVANAQDTKGLFNCCLSPYIGTVSPGIGSITNDPLFVNPSTGDFHLRSNSPCINSGNNAYVQSATDFDGNPRIAGTVDIGAYEFQPLGRDSFLAWLQQYGLPTDGSATYADSDHDGMNNLQEWIAGTSPTDPASALRMVSASPSPTGVEVTWQSVSNRSYFIERSTNLVANPPFAVLATGIPGQKGIAMFMDTNATGPGPFFYRVGVVTDSNHLYTPFSVLSYAWLQNYHLPADGTADFVDTDGDGMNNWQEWKAGTNPTNAASVLKMNAVLATNSSSAAAVSWKSVLNVTYFLQRSTNLLNQPAFSTIQSNLLGKTGATSFTDTNATGPGPFFYRVGVQ
jgi:hypothetical protein